MKFICDAPGGKSWFRIETAAEAAAESLAMRHAVEKFFLAEEEKATTQIPLDRSAVSSSRKSASRRICSAACRCF
jgi:hypothetical protein